MDSFSPTDLVWGISGKFFFSILTCDSVSPKLAAFLALRLLRFDLATAIEFLSYSYNQMYYVCKILPINSESVTTMY